MPIKMFTSQRETVLHTIYLITYIDSLYNKRVDRIYRFYDIH